MIPVCDWSAIDNSQIRGHMNHRPNKEPAAVIQRLVGKMLPLSTRWPQIVLKKSPTCTYTVWGQKLYGRPKPASVGLMSLWDRQGSLTTRNDMVILALKEGVIRGITQSSLFTLLNQLLQINSWGWHRSLQTSTKSIALLPSSWFHNLGPKNMGRDLWVISQKI